MNIKTFLVSSALGLAAISTSRSSEPNYAGEVSFLKGYLDIIELTGKSGRTRVVVVPAYQGRVMTSTADGLSGSSFGWINHELIASGKMRAHINVFGGENRIWLGPEGGPFALFFSKEAPEQSLQYWQTPALFDTQPWRVVGHTADKVTLSASGHLKNRAGTALEFMITRSVHLLGPEDASRVLEDAIPGDVTWVGYETKDRLVNSGGSPWRRQTGLLSIWTLGQFMPGARTTIVVPIVSGSEAELGPSVRSDYFGIIPADRLKVRPAVVEFRADGQARGKIGVSPFRARPIVGSWDAGQGVLTVVEFNLPSNPEALPYVDSHWINMKNPYAGDVINAYNDGPPEPGVPPLGPFYELETSSPAAELGPGQSLTHFTWTFHFIGGRASLDALARKLLGVPLESIEAAFPESH